MLSSSNQSETESRSAWFSTRLILESVALGAIYGVALRFVSSIGSDPSHPPTGFSRWLEISPVMTDAFLFLGPIVIGMLTIHRTEAVKPVKIWQWIVLPWLSVTLALFVLWLTFMEGSICILMAAPVAFACSSIGGIIIGIWGRLHKPSNRTLTCIAVLPFVLAPAEARLNAPTQTRTVSSQIRIHAPATVIWQNIERVPAIAPSELQPNWTHRIGFPRPIEATLSYEGVGGIRHASFERGLLFIETINAWEPQHRIAFTIKADSAHIPSTTLDEHVTIGGRYFDVLNGEYTLEPLPNGDTMLHLISHQRLSTDFNGYAGAWTDAVMQSLQTSILQVIQHRCEATS